MPVDLAGGGRGTLVNRIISLIFVVFLSSCTFMEMSDRPARVSDLVGWVERVHVEAELAQQKMHTAYTMLSDLAAAKYEDAPVAAYGRFATSLEECEAQAEKLRNAIGPMKASAGPVFDQWTEDLEQFSSVAMRERSQKRLDRTQEQYNVVAMTADPVQTKIDAFNRTMRDHALFLGHDFNPASVSMIQDDVRQLGMLTQELDGRFEHCLRAAQDYVNAYSLPVGVSQNPVPGGEGESKQETDR